MRHIERTRTLIHCVSAEEANPAQAYEIVRKELGLYNENITKKPEIIILTKTDLISEEEREEKMKTLKGLSGTVFPLSVLNDGLLKNLSDFLTKNFK